MDFGCFLCEFATANLLSVVYRELPVILLDQHNEETFILCTKSSQGFSLKLFEYGLLFLLHNVI